MLFRSLNLMNLGLVKRLKWIKITAPLLVEVVKNKISLQDVIQLKNKLKKLHLTTIEKNFKKDLLN